MKENNESKMENFRNNKRKSALANIWNIEITDPKDGIKFLKAIRKLESNEYEIENENEIPECECKNYDGKRRNASCQIWNLSHQNQKF